MARRVSRSALATCSLAAAVVLCLAAGSRGDEVSGSSTLDRLLDEENASRDVTTAPTVDDLAFLRRVSIDLIGRIPTDAEITRYLAWPGGERRARVVDALLAEPRFADRWTVFFADMLRVRTGATGGQELLAYVHRAVRDGKPYDTMVRELIASNGKASKTPAVGFVLGDNADPMVLAGATAQVFLGLRIACAQCHDHPFDDWTQEQFYELAAFFGKTKRVESRFTRSVYTTESDASSVLWPPEREKPSERHPVTPSLPFRLEDAGDLSHIARLEAKRRAEETPPVGSGEPDLDDLLESAGSRPEKTGPEGLDVVGEARAAVRELDIEGDLFRASQQRAELARFVTDPRNTYFSRALVNRLWAELFGRGFVEPLDDFGDSNPPSHPRTLDHLAREFVASGFDLRAILRQIVSSRAYQRARLGADVDEALRTRSEAAFSAATVRRMLSEVLYDSIVQAGHLDDYKWPEGANLKTYEERVRVPLASSKSDASPAELAALPASADERRDAEMASESMLSMRAASGYSLEQSIELDFDAVLAEKDDEPRVDTMRKLSKEEIEAMRVASMRKDAGDGEMRYEVRTVLRQVDDNPRFTAATRMPTPAPPAHFLRIFGQPSRESLGEFRDETPSMRQSLLILNGRLTHEASRVGTLEPLHALAVGERADLSRAIRLAYREILTREPTTAELAEARAIVAGAESDDPLDGLADLRWVLLNCHEFRFLP